MSNKKEVLKRLKERALKRLEKERTKPVEKLKELNQKIKEVAIKSPSKEQVQLSQIKKLVQYTKAKRPSLEFALRDPRLKQLKKKIDIVLRQRRRSSQASKLMWLTRQAKNRALAGDWYGAQEAFCYIRDAYQKLFKS